MNRNLLRMVTAALAAGVLSSCSGGLTLPAGILPAADSSLTKKFFQLVRQRVKVVFYNRLGNNELVPLVPDALESLRFNGQFSLDASNFPRHRGLEQTFPFIEPGQNVIELSFEHQEQPVEIPIVVPRSNAAETVILVILAFEASGDRVRDIQVGYDMNNDHVLDPDMDIYRSSNGQSYLIYSPDGQVQEWTSPLLRGTQEQPPPEGSGPLPPGSENTTPGVENPPQPQQDDKQAPPPVDLPKIPGPKPLPLPEPAPVSQP
ncbi:MAG: hypothetical protein ACAI44_04595 [Candidatus Sericytochromatia bacterium]